MRILEILLEKWIKEYSKIQQSTTKELICQLLASQNADGSIGVDKLGLNTSYFIIGMLLNSKDNKEYYIRIKKAVLYLMNIDESSNEAYISLKLAYSKNIYRGMDIEEGISKFEKNDKEGSLIYLYSSIDRNIEEFSILLVSKCFNNNHLIEYLFRKINI